MSQELNAALDRLRQAILDRATESSPSPMTSGGAPPIQRAEPEIVRVGRFGSNNTIVPTSVQKVRDDAEAKAPVAPADQPVLTTARPRQVNPASAPDLVPPAPAAVESAPVDVRKMIGPAEVEAKVSNIFSRMAGMVLSKMRFW